MRFYWPLKIEITFNFFLNIWDRNSGGTNITVKNINKYFDDFITRQHSFCMGLDFMIKN